mmetsp:Transcript_11895/g.22834  ORF Transcript_11895/g.22834 Transcript_11895/m.22834 type:complete len:188 (+) Transcript_11895:507-1070(+)
MKKEKDLHRTGGHCWREEGDSRSRTQRGRGKKESRNAVLLLVCVSFFERRACSAREGSPLCACECRLGHVCGSFADGPRDVLCLFVPRKEISFPFHVTASMPLFSFVSVSVSACLPDLVREEEKEPGWRQLKKKFCLSALIVFLVKSVCEGEGVRSCWQAWLGGCTGGLHVAPPCTSFSDTEKVIER